MQELSTVQSVDSGCGELWQVVGSIINTGAAERVKVVGIVEFGTREVMHRVEFDWVRGATLCIPSDGLRVSCRNDAPPGEPEIEVAATVTRTGGTFRPPVMRSFDIALPSDTTKAVPNFAGEVEYQRQEGDLPRPFRLEVLSQGGLVLYDQTVPTGVLCAPMRLPNESQRVRIVGTGPNPPFPGRLIFWLRL